MHELLTEVLSVYPGNTAYFSLGKFPRVAFDSGTIEVTTKVTKGSNEPLTPAKLAEIVNSLLTDKQATTLKKERFVITDIKDDTYLRSIAVQYDDKSLDIEIRSRLLSDIAAENKKIADTVSTLELIKG